MRLIEANDPWRAPPPLRALGRRDLAPSIGDGNACLCVVNAPSVDVHWFVNQFAIFIRLLCDQSRDCHFWKVNLLACSNRTAIYLLLHLWYWYLLMFINCTKIHTKQKICSIEHHLKRSLYCPEKQLSFKADCVNVSQYFTTINSVYTKILKNKYSFSESVLLSSLFLFKK